MTEKDIRDAWTKIKEVDHTIPDNVLDFMKDCAIEKLNRKRLTLEEIDKISHNMSEIYRWKDDHSICFKRGMLTARNLLG